ncbi:TlpA family protein disulfide reductase [Patescibacteria group bacterium]
METEEKKDSKKKYSILIVIVVGILGVWALTKYTALNDTIYEENKEFGLLDEELEKDKDYITVGAYAAPFRLRGSDGSVLDFTKDILGKKTLLVFETTVCEFCNREIPDFNRIAKEGKVQLFSINIKEEEDLVKNHVVAKDINHPWYLDEDGDVSTYYLVAGTPTHIFIDAEGKIMRRDTGYVSTENLNTAIDQLIAL